MNNQPEDRLARAFDAARAAAQRVPDDEQRARARAQFLLEVKGVSLNGDMRLRDQTGALSDVSESTTGEPRMKRIYSKRARLIAAVLLGVILAGGFWATPSLRALAQEIIDFFVPGGSDTTPATVFVGGEPHEESANPLSLSLDDLAAQADFDVRLPTFIPETYHFVGATYQADFQFATLMYECREPWRVVITERQTDDVVTPMEVGASAVVEDVVIGDVIGQYVRGTWRYEVDPEAIANQGDTVEAVPATRVWTNDSDWQQLFWRDSGLSLAVMTGGGLITTDGPNPCTLAKDDYVSIAEGLQPASTIGQ